MSSFFCGYIQKNKPGLKKIFYAILMLGISYSIYKDVGNLSSNPNDFRNRVVGARMLKDGLSPYFYMWQFGDSERYYNDVNPNLKVSFSTATPFFHWVLGLVADLPQFQLNTLWMFFEYLTLAGCCLLAVISIEKKRRKMMLPFILAFGVFFTYTVEWRIHIANGQNYIFVPFLSLLAFYFLKRNYTVVNAFLFGCTVASLLLISLQAVIIFAPFILYLKKYFKWITWAVGIVLLYLLFVLNNQTQKNNWADYFKSVQVHSSNHLAIIYGEKTFGSSVPDNRISHYEGLSLQKNQLKSPNAPVLESSTLAIFYYMVFGKKLSINQMEIIYVGIAVLLLVPLVILKFKSVDVDIALLFLLGFCMYDIFIFCQPIIRGLYNGVGFLLPVLLLFGWLKKIYVLPICLLLLGLLLHVFLPTFIKMRFTVGEIMMLASLLYFVYKPLFINYLSRTRWRRNNNFYWL